MFILLLLRFRHLTGGNPGLTVVKVDLAPLRMGAVVLGDSRGGGRDEECADRSFADLIFLISDRLRCRAADPFQGATTFCLSLFR